MISAHDVEHAAFRRAKTGQSGYDEVSIDDFLDRAVATIEAIEQGKPAPKGALTSTDVVEAVFEEKDAATDGGYDLDDVDDLLDRVAQRLFEHEKSTGRSATASASDAVAGDDPGDIVDNDHAREDRVYSQEELRPADITPASSGAGATATAGSSDTAHDRDLAGVNPVGGEAVDAHDVTPADESVDAPVVSGSSNQADAPSSVVSAADDTTSSDHTTEASSGEESPSARDSEQERDGAEAPVVAETTFGETVASQPKTSTPQADEREPERTVEQYPATDHRVPLPRGDMGAQLSDDDVRAQQNYHPEFSEYDAASAQQRAAASDAGVSPAEGTPDADRGPDAGALPLQPSAGSEAAKPAATEPAEGVAIQPAPATAATPVEEPESTPVQAQPEPTDASFEPFAHGTQVSDEPIEKPAAARHDGLAGDPFEDATHKDDAPMNNSTAPAAMSPVNSPAPADRAVETPDSTGTRAQDTDADAAAGTAPRPASAPVARPEGIERPEPIDRPRTLPKREENTRKGLLRRIFKG